MRVSCPAQVENKCIVCPAHGTAFDLATGATLSRRKVVCPRSLCSSAH